MKRLPPRLGHAQTPSDQKYNQRILRVLNYIDAHLAEPLPLERLAKIACFSPYHFHRVFAALMGETLNLYVRRRRVEIAAMLLRSPAQRSLTQIALSLGFSSPSSFARAFRAHFGLSATAWREREERLHNRKIGQAIRKIGKADSKDNPQAEVRASHLRSSSPMNETNLVQAQVEVQTLPATEVVYLSHVGPFMGDSTLFARLFSRLEQWTAARSLLNEHTHRIVIAHDDPKVTDPDHLRISAALPIPPGTQAEGEFGITTLQAGCYAVARFQLPTAEIPKAWQSIKASWLPKSGYQADGRPCYERIYCPASKSPEGLHDFEICFPVKPL